jgi:hypothetical protein
MRQAFDGVAMVLFVADILTESLLRNEIPQLVWDSAIAAGWWRWASETPQAIFPERLGPYCVWRDERTDGLFHDETELWRVRLASAPAARGRISPQPTEIARDSSKKRNESGLFRDSGRRRRQRCGLFT